MGGDGDLGLLSTKKICLTAVFNHLTGRPSGLCGQWGAAGTSCSTGNGQRDICDWPMQTKTRGLDSKDSEGYRSYKK